MERAREHLECALVLSHSPRLLHLHIYADVLGKLRTSPLALDALYRAMRERWPSSDWGPRSVARALTNVLPASTVTIIEDLRARGFDVEDLNGTLGAALATLKDYEGARRAFQRAVELEPQSAIAHYNLGALLLQYYDFEGVVAANREATRLAPATPEFWSNLGLGLLHLGVVDEALAASRTALSFHPGQLFALTQVARCLVWSGDLDGALEHARRAVELQAGGGDWKLDSPALLARLEALRGDQEQLDAWLVEGTFAPSAAERARLAWSALQLGRAEEAAGLFSDLYVESPELFSADLATVALHAACSASWAATLTPEGSTGPWLELAMEWFDAAVGGIELEAQGDADARLRAHEQIRICRRDPEVAALREQRWWAALTPPQTEALQAIWKRLESLCANELAAEHDRDTSPIQTKEWR